MTRSYTIKNTTSQKIALKLSSTASDTSSTILLPKRIYTFQLTFAEFTYITMTYGSRLYLYSTTPYVLASTPVEDENTSVVYNGVRVGQFLVWNGIRWLDEDLNINTHINLSDPLISFDFGTS